jgi:cardiolipin synthase
MLHAKTAVSDCCWARVGSSNLNVASWIGNYEMDAVVEDEQFAAKLEEMYLADLDNSTEIVLRPRRRRNEADSKASQTAGARTRRDTIGMSAPAGSASRAAAGALRLGRTVGAALTEQRVLEPAEARVLVLVGALLLGIAVVALIWPLVIAAPLCLILAWVALALFARAHALRRMRRARGQPTTRLVRTAPTTPDADSQPPRG